MTRLLPRCLRPCAGVLTAALAVLLGGCAASGSPVLDRQFGEASRLMRQQQAIDPDAARRADVRVPASDGRTVRHAMDRLAESYRQPGGSSVVGDGANAGGVSLPTR